MPNHDFDNKDLYDSDQEPCFSFDWVDLLLIAVAVALFTALAIKIL